MAREKVTVTPEFKEAVAAYQKWRGIKSWSQALMELAALGYQRMMNAMPPAPSTPWGGDRKSPDYVLKTQIDLERFEVELLGLPPLADDD